MDCLLLRVRLTKGTGWVYMFISAGDGGIRILGLKLSLFLVIVLFEAHAKDKCICIKMNVNADVRKYTLIDWKDHAVMSSNMLFKFSSLQT